MQLSSPRAADYGLFALISALYGGVFILIAVAVETIPPLTVVMIRQLFGAVFFITVAILLGRGLFQHARGWSKPLWGLIILSAFFGNSLPFFLTTWGQESVEPGVAAILISTCPLITVLLAHAFAKDERLDLWKILGVLLGFIGVVYLIGLPQSGSFQGQAGSDWIRHVAIIGSATSFAINLIITRHLVHLPKLVLLAWVLTISFLMVAPFSLMFDQPWTLVPSVRSVVSVILLGLVAGGFGGLISLTLVARQGAGFSAMTNYLIPVMAVFWAWLILAQQPDPRVWISLGLILAGLVLARRSGRKSIASTGRVQS